MKFRVRQKPDNVGFQMTAMIDVVLVLLCFFIVTQVYSQWETEIDITLPTSRTGQIPQRLPGEIIINLYEDGKVVVNGRTLDENALGAMLQKVARLFPGQPVLLRADRDTDYKHVIQVLDQCRQADIWNISFATGVPEET